MGTLDEIDRPIQEFFVRGLHALLGERTCVCALLLAHEAKAWIIHFAFLRCGDTIQHATRAKLGEEFGILGIVLILWLFLSVEVVEVSIELIESVYGG